MAMSDDLKRRIDASPNPDAIRLARQQLASSDRVAAGRKLEDELDDTHKSMAQQGWGCVYRHARETVGTPNRRDGSRSGVGLRYKRGGNPVDYTGFVNLVWHPKSGPMPSAWNRGTQLLIGPGIEEQYRVPVVRIPVVFDAKRCSHLQYSHDPEQMHQVLQLREAAQNGAAAFLLVHHVPTEQALLIGPHHFDTLIRRKPVRLIETKTHQALHPACRYQLGFGWRYAPLIPDACLNLNM